MAGADPSRRSLLTSAAGAAGALALGHGLGACASAAEVAPDWPSWEAFKRSFMSHDGRIVTDDAPGARSYSEGQAYAMFFALAGNDRTAFEQLLEWTQNNLCAGDITQTLPAWLWGRKDDGSWGVIDHNSASDAELWMIYALMEGGRLWREPRYEALARAQARLLLDAETEQLPGLGRTLLPGRTGFKLSATRWRLNPSYPVMQIMDRCANVLDDARWGELQTSSIKLIVGSAPQGFAPDWVVHDAEHGLVQEDRLGTVIGSYNAIRVYLWAGMLHPRSRWRQRLLDALRPMAALVAARGEPPERVRVDTGAPQGVGPSGFGAALLPLLQAVGDDEAVQVQRLRLQARPPAPRAYYENCLALFGLGWMSQQYSFDRQGELRVRWTRA